MITIWFSPEPLTGNTSRHLACSAYARCVSMEMMTWKAKISDEDEFLAKAFETGTCLSEMIAREKACAKV